VIAVEAGDHATEAAAIAPYDQGVEWVTNYG
jgi:hypothetical protein